MSETMEWTKYDGGQVSRPVKSYTAETLKYQAQIDVYKGVQGEMVCEWSVWVFDGRGTQSNGVCYGLKVAKQQVEKAIAGLGVQS